MALVSVLMSVGDTTNHFSENVQSVRLKSQVLILSHTLSYCRLTHDHPVTGFIVGINRIKEGTVLAV